MQLHHSKKVSIYKIARELEKVAQLAILVNSPLERQSLAKYTWNCIGGFEDPIKSKASEEAFSRFLTAFSGHSPDIRMKLCPASYSRTTTLQVYSHGSYLLAQAGIDIQSLDQDIRENICDFICAVDHYHTEVCAKKTGSSAPSFAAGLKNQQVPIQEALLNSDIDVAVNCLTYELMKKYVPSFDLDKITFGNSNNYGNVVYGDPNACEIMKSLQSALKFDLKSLGIDTESYHQAQDISELKQKSAESILCKKGLLQKVTSSLRRKSQDLKSDSSLGQQGLGQ